MVIYIRGDDMVENSYAKKFIEDNREIFDKYKHALSNAIKETSGLYEKFDKLNIFLKLTNKNSYNITADDIDVFKGVINSIISATDLESVSTEHAQVFKDEQAQEYILVLIMPKDNYYNLREPLYEVFFAQIKRDNGHVNVILNVNNYEAFKALMALIVPSALKEQWNDIQKRTEEIGDLDLDI